MPRNKRRSPCPVSCVLDILGDKWTLLVVRDLLLGKSHFHEFAESPERIASNILTERLTRLVECGLAERFPSPERPGRDAYRLTATGRSLQPVLSVVADWGLAHIEGTATRQSPVLQVS